MQKRTGYLLIAVAAVAAGGFALMAPAPAPTPAEPRPLATAAAADHPRLPAALPERSTVRKPRGDFLAAQTWAPPSAPPVAPPKPAPEVAAPAPPPMPYRFVGKVTREGSAQHVLAKGDLIFPVTEGETLDGAYRVEALALEEITLLYIPLGVRTRLHMPLGSDAPSGQALVAAPYTIPRVPAPIAAQAPGSPAPSAELAPPGPIATQAPDLTRTAATGTRAAHLRRERAQQLPPILQ